MVQRKTQVLRLAALAANERYTIGMFSFAPTGLELSLEVYPGLRFACPGLTSLLPTGGILLRSSLIRQFNRENELELQVGREFYRKGEITRWESLKCPETQVLRLPALRSGR